MYACNVLAVSGALIAAAAAVPHQHHKRDVVWETAIDEVVVTVAVTETIWVEPSETPAGEHWPRPYSTPSSTPAAEPTAYAPSSSVAPAPAYTPEPSSSSVYVAPPAYTPETSSSSVYVAPPAYTPDSSSSSSSVYVAPTPTTTSVYVAPTPESTYVAPTPSSSYVAPAESSSAPSGSGALTFGMAKSGTSFTGDLTYYEPGLGACGFTNTTADTIVAISHVIWDSYNTANPNDNPLCQKWVTIKGKDGQDHQAQIVDKCPGCAESDLDLTQTLFNTVTVDGDGRVSGMTWTME